MTDKKVLKYLKSSNIISRMLLSDYTNKVLDDILVELGFTADVTYASIYLISNDSSKFEHICDYKSNNMQCEQDFNFLLNELKEKNISIYDDIIYNLTNNKLIKYSQLEDIPVLSKFGMKSILLIPIYYSNDLKGVVWFADSHKARGWEEITLSYLETITGYITAFLKLRDEKSHLEESEKKAKAIINSTTDAVAMFDINGVLSEVNEEFARRFKLKPKDMIGRNSLEFFPPDVAKRREKFVSAVFKSGKPASTEDFREGIWNDYRVYPVKDENDRIFHAVVFARDITRSREAQEKLKLYRQIYNYSKDPIAVIDPDGKYLHRNNAHRELFGYSDDYVIGRSPGIFIGKDTFKEVFSSLSKKGDYSGEVLFKKDTGENIHIELSAFTIKDNDNNIVCHVGIQRDITDRKNAELEKSKSFGKLRRLLMETVTAMTSVVEIRDRYTAGHQKKVSMLASAIAVEMNLPHEQYEGIKMAALLHDIGKVYVPSEILTKPGKLEKVEFDLIKLHVEKGYEILKTISFPWNVADIVNQHHERLNGTGYPNGLKGDEILLGARIIAVSDVIDAMTSTRPYRSAIGLDIALDEISNNKNTLYDPDVVDACINLFKSNKVNLLDDINLM